VELVAPTRFHLGLQQLARNALVGTAIAAGVTLILCLPSAPGLFGVLGLVLAGGVALAGGMLKRGSFLRRLVEHRLKTAVPGSHLHGEEIVPARGAVKRSYKEEDDKAISFIKVSSLVRSTKRMLFTCPRSVVSMYVMPLSSAFHSPRSDTLRK